MTTAAPRHAWHEGRLFEVDPLGAGFIEERGTGRCFGFHVSMLPQAATAPDPKELEGMDVRFRLNAKGHIGSIQPGRRSR